MAAGDGIPEFITPYSTSEMEAMVRDIVAHFNALRGQAEVVAVDLRRLLPNARGVGGRMPFGIDLKIAARQVSRQFLQVAAAQNAASAAAHKGLSIFHGNFVEAKVGGNGRSFNAGR